MKKVIYAIVACMLVSTGYAQTLGGFRVGLDFGYVPSEGGAGVLFSIEPKYNIADNMNLGLRMGAAAIVRDLYDEGYDSSAKVSVNQSYVATYDYYFANAGKSFVPYLGTGAGLFTIANVDVNNTSNNDFSIAAANKFGGLIRGGFETGKFRMGLEYNLVPNSTLYDTSGNNRGTVSNSYVGIHLGFFIGGGRWNN